MGGVPPDPARLARPPVPRLGRRVWVEVERTVDAPTERVWALLRDYRVARPRSLSEHFSDYGVLQGGAGAGTVITYRLRVGRHDHEHVVVVEEPVAARMLRERARGSFLLSTWTLTPGGDGERTMVRLALGLRDRQFTGWLARVRARRALRRLCARLLEHVDAALAAR
jgi:Polyketide cyclase / dehydrase and lipid transport